ncbi:Transposase [Cohaesibacter sp. ES.047]|uniref:IS21 family transposase n=1 Tax=Cohaesibacter sp. ES.047 TaxID=1798205 RepID=UPI000BB67C68|nr:IS21 family transposase [Cohaesibacter sp. ES.047]SNY89891.1 Transposase [Cohaesibacter sp. ES.047]SNY90084.1 Transposase [Cohaesibacter sp. ES.047]SNY92999.1 Transposase [Cohaesibacter sp. ES.047]SNY93965.1 Transposase [Cohaesibacter sp. ES.047]SNY94414.1 Transposase [Cohaesibacter sp. ES.047]
MPRRKQVRRTTVQDIREILRLTHDPGLSTREVSARMKLSKTTVATYLHRARDAGLNSWPIPADRDDDEQLRAALFQNVGRPPRDDAEPDWRHIATELKRKGVTLTLLWEEYRAVHPEGYGYTWFCTRFREFECRANPRFRNRHEAGAAIQTDYAGHTIPVFDPATGEAYQAQIFVAVLGASNYTFAWASRSQKLPDWIDAQVRSLKFFGGVTKAIICDNLKAAVATPLWFEPSLTATFEAMATHYDTTILPTRPRKPRDKAKVEGAVLIVERWILARLRNQQFFSIEALNNTIAELLVVLNNKQMRRIGRSRKELFEEIERPALRLLPDTPFEYAEWKRAKVHLDYHVEILRGFYSVPHKLIGRQVDVRLTHRVVEIFCNHERVAVHQRRRDRGGHSTITQHMPKAHQRHAGMTPQTLVAQAARIGYHTALLVERLMRDRPHPEQGFRSALGGVSLQRRFGTDRLEAACQRALTCETVRYKSVQSILVSGLDKAPAHQEPAPPAPSHDNIRGATYYQ